MVALARWRSSLRLGVTFYSVVHDFLMRKQGTKRLLWSSQMTIWVFYSPLLAVLFTFARFFLLRSVCVGGTVTLWCHGGDKTLFSHRNGEDTVLCCKSRQLAWSFCLRRPGWHPPCCIHMALRSLGSASLLLSWFPFFSCALCDAGKFYWSKV